MSDTEAVEAVEPVESESVEPVESAEPVDEVSLDDVSLDDVEIDDDDVEPEAAAEPETDDPFASYGGKEVIEEAMRLHAATQSDDGIIQLFVDAGRVLGVDLDRLQGLFGDDTPAEEIDPDEPLTRGDFEAFQRQQAEAVATAQAKIAREAAASTVRSTVADLGLDPADPSTRAILSLADDKTKGSREPAKIEAAIRQAHAEYEVTVEKKAKAYLAKKKQKAAGVPKSPSGSTSSEGAAPEPKDVAEAIRRTRQQLFGS